MSTVAQIVNRIRREFLEPPDLQPTRFTLNGGINSSVTTIDYTATLLTAEEEDLLGPGTVLEIDYDGTNEAEVVLAGTVDAANNQIILCTRGVAGTTGATHLTGTTVRIAPAWFRAQIRDAIADAVVGLYPDVANRKQSAELTTATDTYTEAPSDMEYAHYFWARRGQTNHWRKIGAQGMVDFPPSSTDTAFYANCAGGTTGYLIYGAKFTRPTAETDNLTTLGVAAEWEQLVVVSATVALTAGKDLEPALETSLVNQLATQNFPVGSGEKVSRALLRYEQFLRARAKAGRRNRDPVTVVRNGISGG